MTGPEHYKEAERLLATGQREERAAAAVHATLALAAITAIGCGLAISGDEVRQLRNMTKAK